MSSFWVHRKRDMGCLPSRSVSENVAKTRLQPPASNWRLGPRCWFGVVLDRDVLALDDAGFAEPFAERSDTARLGRAVADESDDRHRRLLRARRERPRCRRAAEQRDELAAFHQQFLPCFEAEDSTAGDLPHCGISKEPLSAVGQNR
jgi:hypothetical protein